jgi:hypothetical protein
MTKSKRVFGALKMRPKMNLQVKLRNELGMLKQLQIHFKHRLQQSHIRSIVESHHIFPDINDDDFSYGQRKQGTAAFEFLLNQGGHNMRNVDPWTHDQPDLHHVLGHLSLPHP